MPSYDNLDWIRGFEWKGLFIKVQTYNESKQIMKEIKALKYAFLDYIKVIDGFKYKTNINSLNLLSNELIFLLFHILILEELSFMFQHLLKNFVMMKIVFLTSQ